VREGPLPRKAFSMGEAHEKRYYVEARRIRPPGNGSALRRGQRAAEQGAVGDTLPFPSSRAGHEAL
jgi:hypothetical protein